MLNLLREKLKTYQNELNIKFIKIYEHRDKFAEIKELNAEQKNAKIFELNEELKTLSELKPESIIGKTDAEITAIIKHMTEVYEN